MIDLVYKLNLPSAKEIILESKLIEAFNTTSVRTLDPKKFLKDEWLKIKNYSIGSLVIFYKTKGHQTNIHSDMSVAKYSNYNWSIWAVNWFDGSDSLIEYWTYDHLKFTGNIERQNPYQLVPCYTPTSLPIKRYQLTPGAYLTNIEIPHRVTSFGNRHNFSVRSFMNPDSTWENVVEEFKDLII